MTESHESSKPLKKRCDGTEVRKVTPLLEHGRFENIFAIAFEHPSITFDALPSNANSTLIAEERRHLANLQIKSQSESGKKERMTFTTTLRIKRARRQTDGLMYESEDLPLCSMYVSHLKHQLNKLYKEFLRRMSNDLMSHFSVGRSVGHICRYSRI